MKSAGKKNIICALDVPTAAEALDLVDMLAPHVGCFKVGLELFCAAGPEFAKKIARKSSLFLDLKLHDIPATVGRSTAALHQIQAKYLTAHAAGGSESLRAIVAQAGPTKVLAVTVLTSLDHDDLAETGISVSVEDLVIRRAKLARQCGCAGVVASGREIETLRQTLGSLALLVVPGIRSDEQGTALNDQKRTVTAAKAITSGANLLVIGRPIRDAPDPIAAANTIAEQIESATRGMSDLFNVETL